MNRQTALLALALAEGVARADPSVDRFVLAGFSELTEAAEAHAYLACFLLQTLATARSESVPETAGYVRRLLEKAG